MFKIVAKPHAWWPVAWSGVTEEGEVVENKIKMRFILYKVDEAIDVMAEAHKVGGLAKVAADAGETLKASKLYAQSVKLFAVDWSGVAVDDGTSEGKRLDWSNDNLEMLMNEPHLFDAVMEAYRQCVSAGKSIAEGN